jgi:hypothetical protein
MERGPGERSVRKNAKEYPPSQKKGALERQETDGCMMLNMI